MKSSKNSQYIKKIQSERIKECMKLCGITGKYIAEKLNYTPQHISYVINGKRNLTTDLAISLANLFNEYIYPSCKSVSMPYNELSTLEKEDYNESDIDDNVCVNVFYDNHVDYRYLLGEVEHLEHFKNLDQPVEETTNYLFINGIKALLYHYGYDLSVSYCPDITLFKNLNPNSPLHHDIQKMFTDPEYTNTIVNVENGNTLELSPAELYQLFQGISASIVGIIERKFDMQQWMDTLNTPEANTRNR